MIIDFDAPILDIYGKEVKDKQTRGMVSTNALLAPNPDGKPMPGPQMIENFNLALRISPGGKVEVSSSEATLILNRIEKVYTSLVYGQMHALLEGTGAPLPLAKDKKNGAEAVENSKVEPDDAVAPPAGEVAKP